MRGKPLIASGNALIAARHLAGETHLLQRSRAFPRGAGALGFGVSYENNALRAVNIFILRDGEQHGPYSEEDARGLIATNTLKPDDLAWYEGLDEWKPLSDVLSRPGEKARTNTPRIRLAATKLLAAFGVLVGVACALVLNHYVAENASLVGKNAELSNAISALTSENRSLKTQSDNLQLSISERSEDNSKLRGQFDSSHDAQEKLEGENTQLKAQIDRLQQMLAINNQSLKEQKAAADKFFHESLAAAGKQAEKDYNESKKRLEELERRSAALARELSSPQAAGNSRNKAFAQNRQGRWIKSKSADGERIVLDDGSVWQVSSFSHYDTVLWLEQDAVTVMEGNDPLYPYKMINADSNEVADVKPISRR